MGSADEERVFIEGREAHYAALSRFLKMFIFFGNHSLNDKKITDGPAWPGPTRPNPTGTKLLQN